MALPTRDRREHDVVAWSPVSELDRTTQRLARLVDEAWGPWNAPGLRSLLDEFRPPADVEETDDAYVVDIELPGVNKKDVEVEVTGRRLTVSGERRERERTGILRWRTRTVGRFLYEVVLPDEIDEDGVKANLSDGVLTVTVPKAASERQPRRRITID
jgi:HSP20 family protein